MKRSSIFLIIVSSFSFIIFLVLIFLSIFFVESTDLFSWSIFDLFELLATMFIGTFFGYFLSVITPKQEKRNEIIASYIDVIINEYQCIINFINRKTDEKLDEVSQREIILMFRMASNDFNDFLSLPSIHNNKKISELFMLIFELKSVITDEPFVSKRITNNDYTKAFEKFCIIKSKLTLYKNSVLFD